MIWMHFLWSWPTGIVIPNTFPSFVPVASSSLSMGCARFSRFFSERFSCQNELKKSSLVKVVLKIPRWTVASFIINIYRHDFKCVESCVYTAHVWKKLCPYSICWLYDWPLHQSQLASACLVSFSLPRYFGQVLQCTRGYCLFRFARIVLHRPKDGLMWWEAFLEQKQKNALCVGLFGIW